MWPWLTLTCAERAPSRGSGYMELRENMYYYLCFLFIYLSNIFKFLYLQCLICFS